MIISKDLFIFGEHIFGTFAPEPSENGILITAPMPPTEAQAQQQQQNPKYRMLGSEGKSDGTDNVPENRANASNNHRYLEKVVTTSTKNSKDHLMHKRHSTSATSGGTLFPDAPDGDNDDDTLRDQRNNVENTIAREHNGYIEGGEEMLLVSLLPQSYRDETCRRFVTSMKETLNASSTSVQIASPTPHQSIEMSVANVDSTHNSRNDYVTVTMPAFGDAQRTLQLSFENVTVLHNDRKILDQVNGNISPGEVLAVMGPSGSGKTTLLDCLSGHRRIHSGSICVNREPLSKKWRRKICYVLQDEIFFPGLTLRETVMYTALLRLPEKMPKSEKENAVDNILQSLELTFCQNTRFGDYINRGLSGGEKKRANIACELLTNPLLMLLDEPTSGLDSHSAISLMNILKRYAIQEQKTIVITVHQPSSEMFHMFDKLLLLYNGCTAYFGEVNNIYKYFQDIGAPIKPHYNPAEFVLEQLKSNAEIREKLFMAAKERNRNLSRHSQFLRDHRPTVENGSVAEGKENQNDLFINNIFQCYYTDIHKSRKQAQQSMQPRLHRTHNEDHKERGSSCEEVTQQLWNSGDSQSNFSSICSERSNNDWLSYPTSFYTQLRVLSNRNFKEAKPRMLSKLNWVQTVVLALMAGAIWFDIPRTEEYLHDLQGWMFFSQTYWMLFALFGALNSFPSERDVVNKERRSGSYRLSAYYIAKMFGELPLVVTLPTIYLMISYPMLGCQSCQLFLLMLLFLLLNTIVAQSVGFFIGVCCMDMNVSITLSALYTLATQLFGGYLSTRIPDFLSWVRYTSMIHYAYQNMQILEFTQGAPIRCKTSSNYDVCRDGVMNVIPYEDILKAQGSSSPLWLNTLILLIFFVVFRGLGYVVLRYIRCPKT